MILTIRTTVGRENAVIATLVNKIKSANAPIPTTLTIISILGLTDRL